MKINRQPYKHMMIINKALVTFQLTCFSFLPALSQTVVTAENLGDKIEFRQDGKLLTSYIFSAYEKYPFFFPVNGPSAASVTSMRNANFPHHSSLFFGCDKVNEGNYWQEGLDRGQIISLGVDILKSGGAEAVVEDRCIWKRPGADAPVIDKRIITVSAPSPDKYLIDFDISMEMLMDVTIRKTNHSLFSVRLDPDLAVVNGGTMINAEGASGEKGTWGVPSPWIDCYGERMEKKEGIAILQHPTNPWFPSPWFTRDYGFFSPTPMFWPENGEFISFKKGDVLHLRYRVVVHSGDHSEAGIAGEFERYASE